MGQFEIPREEWIMHDVRDRTGAECYCAQSAVHATIFGRCSKASSPMPTQPNPSWRSSATSPFGALLATRIEQVYTRFEHRLDNRSTLARHGLTLSVTREAPNGVN